MRIDTSRSNAAGRQPRCREYQHIEDSIVNLHQKATKVEAVPLVTDDADLAGKSAARLIASRKGLRGRGVRLRPGARVEPSRGARAAWKQYGQTGSRAHRNPVGEANGSSRSRNFLG